jgi:hydrogenase nickel incorporation protein HypA/HybF
MHELSLAADVIDLVTHEAVKHEVAVIEEVLIEIGDLSGVEADIFEHAMKMVSKDTLLEEAVVKIKRTPGKGHCSFCNIDFEMKSFFDQCPKCQHFTTEILEGREFRVVSLVTS